VPVGMEAVTVPVIVPWVEPGTAAIDRPDGRPAAE